MDAHLPDPPYEGAPHSGIGTKREFPGHLTVLDLLEQQVATNPDRIAVRYRESQLTFGEINNLANLYSQRLHRKGVRHGDLVPLFIADGPDFVAGLLATIKLGGAFVPIDPGWPIERLEVIFSQLTPRAVLAVPPTLGTLHALDLGDRTVVLDHEGVTPAGEPLRTFAAHRPDVPRPAPHDLIYGYFTSGSTGTPKCALNRHRGLVNRLTAMSGHFGDGRDQIVLQNSRPTFDSSMWQILWPLVTGGTVVLPDRDGILDLEGTCRTIGRYGITITDFVPSVLSALVTLIEVRPDLRAELAPLRRMLVGGEAATLPVLRRLQQLVPHLRITNTYGPTECSIGSVFHDIGPDRDPVPLGRPIPNTAAVVLDDRLRPVAPGVTGEIWIGGECVGAGYLRDPARTEQVFVPNPFPQISGPLIYRTGDLGHVTPDGLLMFGGRRDDQVKIGGVRVELAEIERALREHETVRDAVVVARGDQDSRALVAYVTLRTGEPPVDTAELLLSAGKHLPAETVPKRLTILDRMPLTPNGKVDRRALTQRADTDTGAADLPYTPPGSPEEELVAAVWREVLGRDRVSVTERFADHGGTSLLTHRLGALLGVRLGRPVAIADLLTADTIRAQAQLVAGDAPVRSRLDPAALARDALPDPLPAGGAPRPPDRSRRLLVTGVTGFVGAHLLADLLGRPDVAVTCLVRAPGDEAARQRLTAALRDYGLFDALTYAEKAFADGRLRALAGDLAATGLGLPPADFDRLADRTDGIVHAGALVNFLHDYADHRAPNVLGTRELLRLAATGRGCRVHAVSTFSALAAEQTPDAAGRFDEDQAPVPELLPSDGYSQSKYVMEQLLDNARAQGLDSVVYRLGEVWPARRTGVANPASLAQSLVYACARTGTVFPTSAVIDHLPADLISRFLAEAACGRRPGGDRVHLLRPVSLRFGDLFERLVERTGARWDSYARFHERLTDLVERHGADQRLVRVAMLLPAPEGDGDGTPSAVDTLFTDSSGRFTVRRTDDHAATGVALLTGSPLDDLTAFVEGLADEVIHR
ncbi:non-ribosomal peptide synthetase [Polymorphospora rubra]|uniref:non-ribosomal peptide synthetase n=1 Tax=Polymorphospora rubra TaxID=338584 RepID=UPI0033C849AA